MFTDVQESHRCERFQTEFIDKRLLFTDRDFQMMAIAASDEWNPLNVENGNSLPRISTGSTGSSTTSSNGILLAPTERIPSGAPRKEFK
jgi:hypothetical protein